MGVKFKVNCEKIVSSVQESVGWIVALIPMNLFHRINRVRNTIKKKTEAKNYFKHHRWKLITLLEKYSGVWPAQSKLKRYPLLTFHFFNLALMMFAMGNHLRKNVITNPQIALEGLVSILFMFALAIKLAAAVVYRNRRLMVYSKIVKHYETVTDGKETEVLREFADQGFRLTVAYMGSISVLVGLFSFLPNVKLLSDYLLTDGELKMTLPFPMDYGVEHTEYWYCIALHFLLCIHTGFLANITFDLSFVLQVHHVQALFKIVKIRIAKAAELAGTCKNYDGDLHSTILSAIDLHKECFEMVKMIEDNCTLVWFTLIFMNSVYFGAGIEMISSRINNPVEAFKLFCGFVILLLHFGVIFSQGQAIVDSSSSVLDACYDCKWYNLPVKWRKLLVKIMMRSQMPCRLTGAQFFPLSMEMFARMLKAGMSYYTLFNQ